MKKALLAFILVVLCALSAAAQDIMIVTEHAPPLNYLKKDEVKGLGTEIVEAMMQKLGVDFPIFVMPWARGYEMALRDANVALYSTTRTPERERLFQWVGPLLKERWVIYARQDSHIRIDSLEDAKEVGKIGTYIDDVKEQFLQKNGFMNLDSVRNDSMNPGKLVAGRIDLWISSSLSAPYFMRLAKVNRGSIKEVFSFNESTLYLAFSLKTDPAIVKKWQDAYDELEAEGVIKEIQSKWY
ncbi:substrate-binding periplasmic protein [Salidesulfovibrio onnuriiensis]|uniref:substrate-binding periplasmic protein n=1 Tax=Salidesulfovibrio onnuriiensis TaxID=2583823 RepID=UPI0011C72949|nr:ABC transporter substrate-binding protein [Salidesulfovibrio onnuriiensis]